jgi:hypothetical protein
MHGVLRAGSREKSPMVEIAYHNKQPLHKGLGANSLLWLLTHSKAGFLCDWLQNR